MDSYISGQSVARGYADEMQVSRGEAEGVPGDGWHRIHWPFMLLVYCQARKRIQSRIRTLTLVTGSLVWPEEYHRI
jgi:hypothetical protein